MLSPRLWEGNINRLVTAASRRERAAPDMLPDFVSRSSKFRCLRSSIFHFKLILV